MNQARVSRDGAARIVTLPNAISLVRLICAPVFLWLLVDDHLLAAAALLAVLGASDWVDGWIARRFDQGSDLGKVLDPVADRILLLVGAVALLVQGSLPLVVGVLVLAREVVISVAVLALAAAGARRIDVQWVGKAGTLALMFALPLYLWADAIHGDAARCRAVRGVGHGDLRSRPQLLRRGHLRSPGAAPRCGTDVTRTPSNPGGSRHEGRHPRRW